ncbi:MAG TPA: DMT family transporter [Candidatus Hydrogenedentes bacterium]|nr:DMT family transporter [Candidatus Hydrogenedentota bacterium]
MNRHLIAYIALFVTTFGWSLSPVFIRYLSGAYDPYSQAFIRYFSATVVLVVVSGILYRSGLRQAFLNPATFGLAVANTVMQTAWTVGVYSTTATVAQFVVKLQVPLIILLSFFLFREERGVIRSPLFLIGTLLGLFGVGGVLIQDPSTSLLPSLNTATLLIIFTAFTWSIYAVWGKHAVGALHPVPMFTSVAVYTTIMFGILSFFVGNPHTLISAGAHITALALLSGTLPIAIAHCTFFYAQKHLGASVCTSVTMLNPLITHFIALLLWHDESMYWVQWVGAANLLTGTFLVIHAEFGGHNKTAESFDA